MMKVHLRSISKKLVKGIIPVVIFGCTQVLPAIAFGQNPGDNPDNRPQDVPLDPKMSLLLIAVGAFLAVKVIRKGMNYHPVNATTKS